MACFSLGTHVSAPSLLQSLGEVCFIVSSSDERAEAQKGQLKYIVEIEL